MANSNVMALNLVAQATNTSGNDLDNISGQGAHVVIDITAITGTTPTATFTISAKDTVSGKYYPILVSTALNTVSTTVLRVFPGAVAAANLVANDIIPKTLRIDVAITGTTPAVTAKVGVLFNG